MSEQLSILSKSLLLLLQLFFQAIGLILTSVAGVAVLLHVDPALECLLFATQEKQRLHFGKYQYCELIGSSLLLSVLPMFGLTCSTITLYREAASALKLGRNLILWQTRRLSLTKRILLLHSLCLASALGLGGLVTSGYFASCHTFSAYVRAIIDHKLNVEPELLRGATFEERFFDDTLLLRYVLKVDNAFGGSIYHIDTPCRALYRDPDIHNLLHETHAEKYSGYFGYWYQQDLYSFDYQFGAVKSSLLIELSLTSCWVAGFVWAFSLCLLLYHNYRIQRLDRRDEEERRKEGSLLSYRSRLSLQSSGSSSRKNLDDMFLDAFIQKGSYSSLATFEGRSTNSMRSSSGNAHLQNPVRTNGLNHLNGMDFQQKMTNAKKQLAGYKQNGQIADGGSVTQLAGASNQDLAMGGSYTKLASGDSDKQLTGGSSYRQLTSSGSFSQTTGGAEQPLFPIIRTAISASGHLETEIL